MTHAEAVNLIRSAVAPGEAWAELGAGHGTFTKALAELAGPGGSIWASDRDAAAVQALEELALPGDAALHVSRSDFTRLSDLPSVDGVLMANALHFVHDQESVLRHVVDQLQPGGKLLVVEYDRARGTPWVPYPVPPGRFRELALAVGLEAPEEIGRRASRYHRAMYAALARRVAGDET